MSDTEKTEAGIAHTPPPDAEPKEPNGAGQARAGAEEPAKGPKLVEPVEAAERAEPAAFAEGASTRKRFVLQGNRLRFLSGGVTALLAGFVAFSLMATDAQFRWGVPVGILAIAASSFGILDFVGSFDDPDERVKRRTTLAELGRPVGWVALLLVATLLFIGIASRGYLSPSLAAILIPASFLALIAAVFQAGVVLGPWAVDAEGQQRPLLKRHGFWVVAVGTLLYLPMQGSYSLSDPWETHYGEVAREMLARNDWISTWWAQDGWFWSKPVLDFWMQGLAMGIFGVHYQPGQMLVGAEHGHTPWPEWAVRMPVFILTIVALYLLYKGVAHVFGRRTGLIGALVLATMPQWFLLAHQTITDMPLVATLSSTMGLLLLGVHTPDDQKVGAYEIKIGSRRWRLTGFHLVFGVILMSALPQILYLVSRNEQLLFGGDGYGFRAHLDKFMSGSAGNCGLPGNEACAEHTAATPQFQPALQGLMWAAVIGAVLYMNWGERRLTRLYFLAAWYFAAVATMGKGPAGFGLPICVTFTYIAATQKWEKLLSVEIVSGLLIIAAVAIPWYLAMYIRHGQPFTDRLIFHDMYKRAMTHVHDTNEGDDVSFRFYIWQLGYALFIWTGLVPAGLVWWTRRRDDAARGQGDVSVFLAMWFVFAFALFTAMLTKFHHYIFPAVPPAAMLTGIMIDRMIGKGPLAKPGALAKYLGGAGLGALLSVYGLLRMFPGSLNGFRADNGTLQPPSLVLGALCLGLGVGVAIASIRAFGLAEETAHDANADEAAVRTHENLLLGGVGVAGAIVVALVGRDLAAKADGGDIVGEARLLHLFTYNYRRAWPESLEWGGTLAAFAIVATVLMLLLAVERFRRHAIVLLTATALGFAVWGLDVYLVKCAPHWGQREVIAAYYSMRANPKEPIVAYQMNWKGENFYTGNQIPAFVSSGATFTSYIKGERDKGIKTFFFVTEHSRSGSLKNELGGPKTFEMLTDKRLNNKFGLVKATFD